MRLYSSCYSSPRSIKNTKIKNCKLKEEYIYIPEIGSVPLDRLSQSDLQEFYLRLKLGGRLSNVDKCGKELSDRMIRACHASCRTALEKAANEGLIPLNPAVGCKLPPKKAREMQG